MTAGSAPSVGMLAGRPISGVLFDLDGTLADTDDSMVARYAARLGVLQRLFKDGDARSAVRRLLLAVEGPGNGLVTLLDRLHLDDEAFRVGAFKDRLLGQRPREQMALIPGVHAALMQLKGRYGLALVTTRGRQTAQHFLETYDLTALFDVVVTRDDVTRLKPHPEPVLLAARRLNLPVSTCVMVGDTVVDVRSGRAAGAVTVGVLCGFGQRQDLHTADIILDSTADLVQLL